MGATPGSFWMSPHDIYVQLTTGPGSGKLDAAQQALNAIWKDEEERATRTRLQGVLIQSAWQGPASDAAYGAAEPLAKLSLSNADLLNQAQDLADRQSGSFNRAKNDVRPVGEQPPEPNLLDTMAHLNDYEKQVTDYQSAAQHNIDVFRGYDDASSYNETRMPTEYSTPSHTGAVLSVVPDGSQGGDVIKVPDQKRQAGDPGPGGMSEPRQFGGRPEGGEAPVGGSGADVQPPRQTSPSDFVPPGPVGPGPGGQPLPGSQPVPGGPGQSGFVPGGGFGQGGPIAGPRGGAYGGGPGRGPGGGVGGPGATGRGPSGAFGPGALAAEEAAAQRAAARGTGSGAMGGAPVGTGPGKRDEDDEHKRKVLIEADTEGLFGSDLLTAPQVIGDDAYEDD